nr:hypothetical protein [Sphingomonas sp. PL-96]
MIEGFWEGAVEAAYRRWGFLAGAAALFAPFLVLGLLTCVLAG